MTGWWIWPAGAAVLVVAGFAGVAVPRWRAAHLHRRTAWSRARAAIKVAAVSRDAGLRDPQAEALLHRAELIVAGGGGERAAGEAADLAREADRRWRAR
ncbi:DUF6403 family protein [Catenuloplanes sp. NPDC051500]|uniref:DUF6403 family protein n=1 Tax=Catenuloplanes sp. NPDC051500 TaxID=3363959 RepID=UPI0037BC68A6